MKRIVFCLITLATMISFAPHLQARPFQHPCLRFVPAKKWPPSSPTAEEPPFLKEQPLTMQDSIEHVVVVMLENRSFDNVLAWLYSVDSPELFIPESTDPVYQGLTDDTLAQYRNVAEDSQGNVIFSTPPIKGIPSTSDSPYINSPATDPYESFPNVLNQIYGDASNTEPTMTGFLQNYASAWWESTWQEHQKEIFAVMETYTPEDLPVLNGLAKHYAVSDQWFSSVPTDTNPNRAFAACGTSEGQIVNGPLSTSLFTNETIWNRLSEVSPNTTWKIFWHSNMVPLLIFGPLTSPNTFSALNKIPDLDSHYQTIDGFHELARNGQLPHFSFIEPQMTSVLDISTNDLLPLDILPEMSMTIGYQGNDMHPPGDVRTAENLIANIYTSLIANKEAWNKTLLIITFDEHGGLFDHVPPPAAIAPDSHFENGFMFDRYGVRVPAIFISPLVQKSTVVRSSDPSMPYDHTSLISTIMQWRNVDKSLWNLGNRAYNAPTFDAVLQRGTPRNDAVIAPVALTQDPVNSINIGDQFYLRNKDGNYAGKNGLIGSSDAKVAFTFTGGTGGVTHGSFALIQSEDSSRGRDKFLSVTFYDSDCFFAENIHYSGQGWTIKSVDVPYLGAPIQSGDRIYLENHVYMNPFAFVPTRLTAGSDLCTQVLTCEPVTSEGSDDNYWIIEKAS